MNTVRTIVSNDNLIEIQFNKMENLQYPIGKFNKDKEYSKQDIAAAIIVLKNLPHELKALTKGLNDINLAKIYRTGGWNIRQIVHHIADSHANMYIRLKCSLTESNPTIKGYNEADWAEMSDSKLPIESSIAIINGLHTRIVNLLDNMSDTDFEKTYYHPGYDKIYVLKTVVALYGWHSTHHLEHIKIALKN